MKIVIVDNHPLVREGLSSLLSIETDMEVVGEASNVDEGVAVICSAMPDLAIIDLKLGNQCGLEIIKNMKKMGINCKFAVLTSSANEDDFRNAEEINVDGYIMKEALPEEIIYAVKVICKGRKYFDPGILDIVMKNNENNEVEELTDREREVLAALGRGLSNKDIAKTLFITEYTVKKHVSQILGKLNLTDRTQAALYANNRGIVKYR